jgi:hypothetical protein
MTKLTVWLAGAIHSVEHRIRIATWKKSVMNIDTEHLTRCETCESTVSRRELKEMIVGSSS